MAAGYAADRTTGDTAQRVTTQLLSRLQDGQPTAVVGPAGAGKSTVCKQTAYRWYEADRGPVFYRSDGAGGRVEHAEELLELARTVEGHALVVVENATHPDARPAVELAETLSDEDDPTVSVLFDARRDEWDELTTTGSVEPFYLPEVDETDCARLVETVRSLGAAPELPPPSELLAAGRQSTHATAVNAGVTLGVVHRLATLLDPLATDPESRERDDSTPLVAVVEAAIEATTAADPAVFDVALAVQVCIVADQPISLDLLYGLYEDPRAVDTAIELLTGRALFPPVTNGTYRTVHSSWAAMFVRRAIERHGETAVQDRLNPRLTALLALADDPTARDRLRELVGGQTPLLDRIEADPQGWADGCVERLHTAALEYQKIVGAFGHDGGFALPSAATDGLALLGRYRRAQAAERSGEFDRAMTELDHLREQLAAGDTVPPGYTRTQLEVRANLLAGRIQRNRGELDTAEELLTAALSAAESEVPGADGDDTLAGRCRYELGDVARQRGRLEAAADLFEACTAHDDQWVRAKGVRGLGLVEHVRGNYATAATRLQESLSITERLGDREGILETLNVLGANAVVRGDITTAGERFRRSIDLARRLGKRQAEAEALNNLGEVCFEQGDREAAREHYERALEVAREVGVDRSVAIALCNLGRIQSAGDEPDAAADSFREALAIGERLESPRLRLHAHRGLATVARSSGDYTTAVEEFDRAEALAEKNGNERMAAKVRAEQSIAMAATGDQQAALDQFVTALETLEELDALTDAFNAVEEFVDVCTESANTDVSADVAATACRRGIDIATAAGREDEAATFEQRLVDIQA